MTEYKKSVEEIAKNLFDKIVDGMSDPNQVWSCDPDKLIAEALKVERMRADELERQLEEKVCDHINEPYRNALKRVDELESLALKMKEALENYGDHAYSCLFRERRDLYPIKVEQLPPCSCGFSEALELWKKRK